MIGKVQLLTPECRILIALIKYGGIARAKELEQYIAIATLYRALKDLIIAGYVIKEPNGAYRITKKGVRAVMGVVNELVSLRDKVVLMG